MTTVWMKEADWPKEHGEVVLLGNPEWKCPDLNPKGVMEGYYQDDEGWLGSVWNAVQDCWVPSLVTPTYIAAIPELPE